MDGESSLGVNGDSKMPSFPNEYTMQVYMCVAVKSFLDTYDIQAIGFRILYVDLIHDVTALNSYNLFFLPLLFIFSFYLGHITNRMIKSRKWNGSHSLLYLGSI